MGPGSSVPLNRYSRVARSWSELALGELLWVDEAIDTELRAVTRPSFAP